MAIPEWLGTTSYPHLLVQDGKRRARLPSRPRCARRARAGSGGTDDALGVTGPYNGMWGHPAFWGGPNGAYVYTVESNGYLERSN